MLFVKTDKLELDNITVNIIKKTDRDSPVFEPTIFILQNIFSANPVTFKISRVEDQCKNVL